MITRFYSIPFSVRACLKRHSLSQNALILFMAVLRIFFPEIYNNDSWFQFKARNGYDFDCAR